MPHYDQNCCSRSSSDLSHYFLKTIKLMGIERVMLLFGLFCISCAIHCSREMDSDRVDAEKIESFMDLSKDNSPS